MHKIKIGIETSILHEIYKEMRSLHHLLSSIKEDYFKENNSEAKTQLCLTICRM